MQIVILSGPGWHADQLSSALTERGHMARVLPYEGLVAQLGSRFRAPGPSASHAEGLSCGPTAILDADAVLARFIPSGSLEQIIYRVDALHWIEEHGVPVVNSPRAIERSVDKFYTDARLQEAGLPIPETVVCEGTEDAMAAIRAMLGRRSVGEGGDVIIKPIFGSMGHGIVRVSDPDVAFRVLQSLEQVRAVFYVQRAIESGGRDVRAFVVGGRVLGAIERRAEGGDWRTNVSRGGSARPFELPPAWEALAIGAAAAVGADYAGVDLLPSQDGTVFVLEVNGIPGWQGLQRATGIDVAGAIVEHVLGRIREFRSASAVRMKQDPAEELPA
jgi:RimK family alpha-L-glutamate ligase